MTLRWSGWSSSLTILGLVLIALALIFLLVIFPGMIKMPADYEQEYVFEGSVQVYVAELGALVPIQTQMTRELTATGVTDDDVLLLRQDITFFEATSGAPLTAINPALASLNTSEVYGLDRTERTNVSGEGDMNRSGQFTFPADVQQETYQYWSSSTRTTLPATFEGEETYQDLNVYVFEINSDGNAYLPDEDTGLPSVVLPKGSPLPNTPEFKASGWISYSWPVQFVRGGEMVLRGQYSYTSESQNLLVPSPVAPDNPNPSFTNDSYAIGDLRLGLISHEGGWQVDLFVYNITDERAEIFNNEGDKEWVWGRTGEYDHVHDVFTNRPREYGVRFSKKWGD